MDEFNSAGIGIALGLGLLYVVLRGTAWSPGRGDPVQAVRTHAMVTALIALFASGTAGLDRLSTAAAHPALGQGAFPVTTETVEGGIRQTVSNPLPPLGVAESLVTVLGPVLGLVLVYVVAQHTWPRPSGAVRTARLTDRRPAALLPRALTAVAALTWLGALGLVALAWSTPGVEAQVVEEFWGGTGPDDAESSSSWTVAGVRAGAEVAPWLLAALVLTALGFLVVLRVIARRPVLHGLHPADDDLVRRIAVNRALRTATAMMAGIGMAGYGHHAAVHPAPEGIQWPGTIGLALMVVLLLWHSPAVAELGSHTARAFAVAGPGRHDAGPAARVPTAPAAPGTARAVLRLRRDGVGLAWLSLVPVLVVAMFVLLRTAATGGGDEAWRVVVTVALGSSAAVIALAALGLARMAMHRPPLGRASAAQDAALRTAGADRMLAVGAAGILAVTGAALLLGMQVWNMFVTSAVLDLGINDLPAGLLALRTVVLFVLFALIVACLVAPGRAVPGLAEDGEVGEGAAGRRLDGVGGATGRVTAP